MGKVVFHACDTGAFSAVKAHMPVGDDDVRVKSEQVYPPPRPLPATFQVPPADPGDTVAWQDGIQMLPRGRETLIVEPETAQWAVLDERAVAFFALCRQGVPVNTLLCNAFMAPPETLEFLTFLLAKNILRRLEWPLLHPPVMPVPFRFPSFFSIHLTDSCNFKCTYCYADAASSGKKMKKTTALTIIDKIFDDFFRQDITIEFHGGEPLLARGMLGDLCARIREREKKGKGASCTILLQTNGSLVTPADIELFKTCGISVGVSLDGPREVHDRNRVYHDGRGTWEDAMRGFRLLRENHIRGGLLAVVQDPREYVDICRFILDQGITGFRLNHMICQGRGDVKLDEVTPRGEFFAREFLELVDFLYDYSVQHPELSIDVWPLNIMLAHLVSAHRPFMCMRSPCGAGSHGLGFDYRGDIYPCEQLAGFSEMNVGTALGHEGLRVVLEKSPVIQKVKERTVQSMEKCRGCTWRNFCGGGCTAEAFAVHGKLMASDIHCTFYERTFENLMWALHKNGELIRLAGAFAKGGR